jgi:putative phosphoesterase
MAGGGAAAVTIGLISDTHGLLRPEALQALHGSDHIIHAGDVGDPAIVDRLASIAPVTVVRGNIDREPWAEAWPATEVVDVGGLLLYVLHDLAALDLDPAVAGFAAVIFGHTHRPTVERRQGVLYVNPGSAGPRRFSLPISVGAIAISGTELSARVIELRI